MGRLGPYSIQDSRTSSHCILWPSTFRRAVKKSNSETAKKCVRMCEHSRRRHTLSADAWCACHRFRHCARSLLSLFDSPIAVFAALAHRRSTRQHKAHLQPTAAPCANVPSFFPLTCPPPLFRHSVVSFDQAPSSSSSSVQMNRSNYGGRPRPQ